ncbi:hypothetical protein ACZ75_05275 [Massilia sp. NR 4-1]|nr:hypothetical protein ACZ75_05275 [Massilia sp. NR 4-1]
MMNTEIKAQHSIAAASIKARLFSTSVQWLSMVYVFSSATKEGFGQLALCVGTVNDFKPGMRFNKGARI